MQFIKNTFMYEILQSTTNDISTVQTQTHNENSCTLYQLSSYFPLFTFLNLENDLANNV